MTEYETPLFGVPPQDYDLAETEADAFTLVLTGVATVGIILILLLSLIW